MLAFVKVLSYFLRKNRDKAVEREKERETDRDRERERGWSDRKRES